MRVILIAGGGSIVQSSQRSPQTAESCSITAQNWPPLNSAPQTSRPPSPAPGIVVREPKVRDVAEPKGSLDAGSVAERRVESLNVAPCVRVDSEVMAVPRAMRRMMRFGAID